MDSFFDKIVESIQDINDNRDYVPIIKDALGDNYILEKFIANDKCARFYICGDRYNYRIYINFVDDGKYLLEIRKAIADIYKSYGIHWELLYKIQDFHIVVVEEREKLKLCDENEISCDDLYINWKKTVDILSSKLNLDNILLQIKKEITTYKKIETRNIIIIKNGLINPNDYAFTPDGHVILLEDYDFVFCFTDYKGNLVPFKGLLFDVDTTCGKMTLSNVVGTTFNDKITHIYEPQEKFFLYDYSFKPKYFNDTINNFDDILQAQIDIFTDTKDVKAKYQREYMNEYFEKLTSDGKYVIKDTTLKELSYDRNDEKRLS